MVCKRYETDDDNNNNNGDHNDHDDRKNDNDDDIDDDTDNHNYDDDSNIKNFKNRVKNHIIYFYAIALKVTPAIAAGVFCYDPIAPISQTASIGRTTAGRTPSCLEVFAFL